MPPSLKNVLGEIGLGDKEAQVLLVLLENGPMLVSAIGASAKLNRTTTYGILKELAEKGLASYTKREGVVRYQSIDPELLPSYIERQRETLSEVKKQVSELVPQLKLLRSRGRNIPKVQFFEGKEGVMQAYEDTLENNPEKLLRDITGIDAVFNNLDAIFLKYYLEKRARLGVKCLDIVPDTDGGHKSASDDEKYMRTTKFIPQKFNFDGEVSIYGNKVGLFSYADQHPVALIIEDETIAHMMKQIFDYIESTTKDF